MAEVFGIAAGVAGFVSLLVQINSGIETLRDIRKRVDGAPKELTSLTQELQFLADIMERVIQNTPSRDSSALQHCQASCDEVVVLLDNLKKRFLEASEEHGPRRFMKILAFRQWKDAIDNLHRSIQAAKINLTLVCVLRSNAQVEELVFVNNLHLSRTQSTRPVDDKQALDHHVGVHSETPPSLTPDVSRASDIHGMSNRRRANPRRRRNCFTKHCSCACHRKETLSGRFWALRYTPLATFQKTCDSESCAGSCYGISFRAALSQFGIRWAVMVDLHLLSEEGKVILRPALGFQRVVPYTSPGFELIWRVNWEKLSAQEAQKQLQKLAREDPSFTRHVNPAGIGYLEEFMSSLPSCIGNRWQDVDELLNFISFLSNEVALLRFSNAEMIVGSCASIWGLSTRDKILDILLASGLEPTEVGASFAEHLRPNLSGVSEDLYFGLLRRLCSHDHGFADMTNLHGAALDDFADFANLMVNSTKDARNSLGQTPMHLAVQHPDLIKALIQHGHDVNAEDVFGFTPLAYAAAFNLKKAVTILLEAGADPSSYAVSARPMDPLWVARCSGHWDLVVHAIEMMEKLGLEEEALYHSISGIHVLLDSGRHTAVDQSAGRLTTLSQLLAIYDHQILNTCEDRDYSLISPLRRVEDLQVLVEHGFNIATHMNDRGLCFLSLIWGRHGLFSPDFIDHLVELGVNVNHEDNLCQTPLRHIFMLETHRSQAYITSSGSSSYDDNTPLLDQIADNSYQKTFEANRYPFARGNLLESVPLLLRLGADAIHRDKCRCSCDPQGCLPTAALNVAGWLSRNSSEFQPPLVALEFIHTLREHGGVSAAKNILISFIRRAAHRQLDMTHVCCYRNLKWEPEEFVEEPLFRCESPLNDEDTNEILEEESEFIEILEREINSLAHESYGNIMQHWFSQIGELQKAYHANPSQHEREFIPTCSKIIPDYEQDRLIFSFDETVPHDPVLELAKHFACYVRCLDEIYYQKYYQGYYTSRLDKHQKHQQYARRRGWLHELLRALDLSPAAVVTALREITQDYTQEGETFDIEGACDRFMNRANQGETWVLGDDS